MTPEEHFQKLDASSFPQPPENSTVAWSRLSNPEYVDEQSVITEHELPHNLSIDGVAK